MSERLYRGNLSTGVFLNDKNTLHLGLVIRIVRKTRPQCTVHYFNLYYFLSNSFLESTQKYCSLVGPHYIADIVLSFGCFGIGLTSSLPMLLVSLYANSLHPCYFEIVKYEGHFILLFYVYLSCCHMIN